MDELTEEEIQILKHKLSASCTQLEELLVLSKAGAQAVAPDPAIGRLTRMDAIQQQSMTKANRESYSITLQQARQALRAIEADDYGHCRGCEEPIGIRRLHAKPETPFCVNCQSTSEKRC
jgi:DnaK suppressor protein